MLPGTIFILACPSCGALHQLGTLRSGNTFGARRWTDGRVDAPDLPDIPRVTCCHPCGGVFWLRSARKVGEFEPWMQKTDERSRQWKAAPPVTHLGEEQLLTALTGTLAQSRGDWLSLRIRAWWASNDPFRREALAWRPWPSRSLEAQENVRVLTGLLSDEDAEERLMKAETLRERECFDEALALLRRPLPENFSEAASFLKELARQGISELRPLP